MEKKFQLVIIGAGVTGLLVAREARAMGLSFTLVDSGSTPGGSMAAILPEGNIFDPDISLQTKDNFLKNLLLELKLQDHQLRLNCSLTNIRKECDRLEIATTNGNLLAENLVICAGHLVYGETSSITYKADDLMPFAGKEVLVYGGKHEATGLMTAVGTVANSIVGFTPAT